MKTVSVIVPCYNQADYLAETLQSVLQQTYPHWECIVVDDGSPDRSASIAQQFVDKDKRFKLLKKANGGVSSARNAGIELATGDYIQFLDSDDLLHPQKFELQLKDVQPGTGILLSAYLHFEDSLDKAYPNLWNAHETGKLREDILFHWGNNFTIPIHTALFARSYFTEHGVRFSELFTGEEDWVFWVACTAKNAQYQKIKKVLAYYRQHAESACKNKEMMIRNKAKALFYIAEDLLAGEEKKAFQERIQNDYATQLINLHEQLAYYQKGKKKYRKLFVLEAYLVLVLLIGLLLLLL